MALNEKRILQQVRNFEKALEAYTFDEPLARFLTRYFKENKQMGSSDRKMTSRFCYNYFRIGDYKKEEPVVDRLLHAEYLCEVESSLVALLHPTLQTSIHLDLSSKTEILGLDADSLFPYTHEISESISKTDFLYQQLVQPDLFIRIKRGHEVLVEEELNKHEISFAKVGEHTLALVNGSRLQDVKRIQGAYEVQDWSSQQTIDYMDVQPGESWWDACAASGGKSLMLLDKYPNAKLLVSDIRLSILRNLDERFDLARVRTPYRKKIIDLTGDTDVILQGELFDGIILDVPCSGSGTWGRTPEMKIQFTADKLHTFSQLQRQIASRVATHLKKEKAMTYITCSVYKAENEDIIDFLVAEHGLQLDKMQIIHGYREKADTMFVARLVKV